jgi:hypothetical protein
MPRVKRTPEELGRIDTGRAAGQASVILLGQLEDCGAAMRTCLDAPANAGEDGDAADYYFGIATRLAEVSSRLADSITRTRGETLHNIRVERRSETDGNTKGATRSVVPNVPIGE